MKWINLQESTSGFAAIHFAAFNGNIEMAQMLMEQQADYELKSIRGETCLHYAAMNN